MRKKLFLFSLLLLFIIPIFITAQTPPEEFLGHKVGADRKLADYNQLVFCQGTCEFVSLL